jgi:small subunit ribosomal protein S4
VLEARALSERDVPDYIEVDDGKLSAKLVRAPALNEVPYAVAMEPHLVVEYYSR